LSNRASIRVVLLSLTTGRVYPVIEGDEWGDFGKWDFYVTGSGD
jgi:hypothetical protein